VYLQINIKDRTERVAFAADLKGMLRAAKIQTEDYKPEMRFGKKADIGIKAENISLKVLAQIVSQIERRGYDIKSTKGPESLSLSFSALSPQ
jgi:hypothetical protein